ncbi:MAG: hypothetical protein HOD43_01405 [Candidatus Marinimicrobia bacterium]|nr:hypothetical protein [Candidatus Neomarinimicrobiota bacterium]MBT3632258.1 hypothetical protein [Candidatus Neomarinimicrobiota bacterium]MBT3825934.1 hypothetical protein [Candidatus Neomarinimicrobiota bacterium]MBT4129660.1 hypothetical protein [Candidatus Neomarinimicrobiota bacterium]MBT4294445.1 hypothetical protein [Candidatus Neomarinimicrobiota bacterium]
MMTSNESESRKGFCPVYDIDCPSGLEAAEDCENRFKTDYNPLTNFRDSDIEHCAIYRMEQKVAVSKASDAETEENKNSSKDGE